MFGADCDPIARQTVGTGYGHRFHVWVLIGYVCLYSLIDRVMKCIEHCATARAYGRFREAGVMTKMDDVAAGIAKSKEEKSNV